MQMEWNDGSPGKDASGSSSRFNKSIIERKAKIHDRDLRLQLHAFIFIDRIRKFRLIFTYVFEVLNVVEDV